MASFPDSIPQEEEEEQFVDPSVIFAPLKPQPDHYPSYEQAQSDQQHMIKSEPPVTITLGPEAREQVKGLHDVTPDSVVDKEQISAVLDDLRPLAQAHGIEFQEQMEVVRNARIVNVSKPTFVIRISDGTALYFSSKHMSGAQVQAGDYACFT